MVYNNHHHQNFVLANEFSNFENIQKNQNFNLTQLSSFLNSIMASMAAEFALISSGLNFKKRIFNAPISSPAKLGFKHSLNYQVTKSLLQEDLKCSQKPEGLVFDVVKENELREHGFLGMRKTKLVCTVGPACCSGDELEKLALGGMNVARLNMCHNTIEWHQDVIRKIKRLNQEKGFCVSVMIDTEGSQIHVLDHGASSSVKAEVFFISLILLLYFFFTNLAESSVKFQF